MPSRQTNAVKTPRGQSVREALPRLEKMLSRRGLTVPVERDVPLFRAAPGAPGVLIRLLNGKETLGRIDARGTFRPMKKPERR